MFEVWMMFVAVGLMTLDVLVVMVIENKIVIKV